MISPAGRAAMLPGQCAAPAPSGIATLLARLAEHVAARRPKRRIDDLPVALLAEIGAPAQPPAPGDGAYALVADAASAPRPRGARGR